MTILIFVICGPCGVGKTTQGKLLSNKINYTFIEGDTFHSKENILKMSKGIPLNDVDRWEWLNSIRDYSILKAEQKETNGVVITCSALKRSYRNVIRSYEGHSNIKFYFLFLIGERDEIFNRVINRNNHYMKGNMVDSQIQIQELPLSDETDSIIINATGNIQNVSHIIFDTYKQIIKQEHNLQANSDL